TRPAHPPGHAPSRNRGRFPPPAESRCGCEEIFESSVNSAMRRCSANLPSVTCVPHVGPDLAVFLEGHMTDLLADVLKSFRGDFAGRVVTGDDADYEAVRAECVWNGDIERRPWIIARAVSAQDVAAALRLGRASGRDLTVRGGGHNFSG